MDNSPRRASKETGVNNMYICKNLCRDLLRAKIQTSKLIGWPGVDDPWLIFLRNITRILCKDCYLLYRAWKSIFTMLLTYVVVSNDFSTLRRSRMATPTTKDSCRKSIRSSIEQETTFGLAAAISNFQCRLLSAHHLQLIPLIWC